MPGNIWDCIKSAKYRFVLKDRMWDFSRDAIGGMGLIFRYGGTTWFFSSCGEILELRRGSQPSPGLAVGSPIFPSGCEGKLGVALESLQGRRDLT